VRCSLCQLSLFLSPPYFSDVNNAGFQKCIILSRTQILVIYEQSTNEKTPNDDTTTHNNAKNNNKSQTNFLKKKSGDYRAREENARINLLRTKRGEEPLPSPRKDAPVIKQRLPDFKSQKVVFKREKKDFLQDNKREQMEARPPVKNTANRSPEIERHENYGAVPSYLQKRKQKWAIEEKERIANMPDEDCPEGMVCMPESERVETLEVLNRSEEEAKKELFALPLTVETVAMTRKKNALEAKLKEIEDAKKIFSRAKVYISM